MGRQGERKKIRLQFLFLSPSRSLLADLSHFLLVVRLQQYRAKRETLPPTQLAVLGLMHHRVLMAFRAARAR